jgi:hypothetical protein
MKPAAPMTHLTTVSGGFHAKVLVARLGAEGIPALMSGGADGLYPIFVEVAVFVPAVQADLAREILLADAVDAVFDEIEPDEEARSAPQPGNATGAGIRRTIAAVAASLIVVLVLVGYLAEARAI